MGASGSGRCAGELETMESINVVDTTELQKIGMDGKCSRCAQSICCNSINQKIPAPRSKEDFDFLMWQVSHENINVFKDSDGWFLHVNTRCVHLLPNGACGIYETRPWVCREYKNDFCEFDESIEQGSELFFSTPEQLEKYCRKRFKYWSRRFEVYE